MSYKTLRFSFFVLSIFMLEPAVTAYSDEVKNVPDPAKKQKQVTSEDKQAVIPEVAKESEVTEKESKLVSETGTPYAKMTDSQISQMKRYDCRLRKKIIPHNYNNQDSDE